MRLCDALGKALVVSPHLDDAVFGCSQFLCTYAPCDVVTVFAGFPPQSTALSDWDQRCGFDSADQAMRSRRAEDRMALKFVGARALHLNFLDAQYAANPPRRSVELRLRTLIKKGQYGTVVFPAGLFHDDHMHVQESVLNVRASMSGLVWLLYEDCLYRQIPGLLQQRLGGLLDRGIIVTPVRFVSAGDWHDRKRAAVSAYESQLKGLNLPSMAESDLEQAERYWLLE